MPAFAFRHIKDLYPVFWAKSSEAVLAMTETFKSESLKKSEGADIEKTMSEHTVIEVGEWVSRATLDIIGIAGMGQDFGAIQDPNTPLNRTYRKVFKPSREAQFLGLLFLFLPGWFVRRVPIKRNGEIEAAAGIIRSTCRTLIRAKKEKLEKNTLHDVDILSVCPRKRWLHRRKSRRPNDDLPRRRPRNNRYGHDLGHLPPLLTSRRPNPLTQ